MKKLLYLLLFASSQCFGQVKILFDASTAQMAGNADWVINADAYNLGYVGTGAMVVGHGTESNPARFPSPPQSGITASTPETYWAGSLSSWGVDMVKLGYQVESLPYNGKITYGDNTNAQDLSNYKVFICDEPNIQFSLTAKQALVDFVNNGGGLFIISDHDQSDRNGDGWDSPHIWNDLMADNNVQPNPFGMTFDYLNFSQTTTNIANLPTDSCLHGPLGNVTSIKYSNGTSITLSTADNSTVTGLIYVAGSSTTGSTNALVARCYYGKGKVAALGDSSPPDDGTGDPNDINLYTSYSGEANGSHRKLLVNTTIWLAALGTVDTTHIDTTHTDTTVTAIRNDAESFEFRLYPNPTKEEVQIFMPAAHSTFNIEIRDIAGRRITENTFTTPTAKFNVSGFAKGIYMAIATFDGNRIVRKFSVD